MLHDDLRLSVRSGHLFGKSSKAIRRMLNLERLNCDLCPELEYSNSAPGIGNINIAENMENPPMMLLQWRIAFTHYRFYLFADPSDHFRHSTCIKETLRNERVANGLSYERKALVE